ncbi:MAG: hypothetical protein RL154_362 [Pseudomonadota bacterium]|jgi:ech hydrogenase subunit A
MSLIIAILPIIAAIVVLFLKSKARNFVTIASVAVLSGCVLTLLNSSGIKVNLSEAVKLLISIFDFVLLGYFFTIGVKSKMPTIWGLALLQTIALIAIEWNLPKTELADFIVDDLSIFMFCLVSFIGGLIVIFALEYISQDTQDEAKQSKFIAILLAFLGVMNLLVQTDNLVIFFTLFECTTLASFLLVRFRQDEQSIANSNRILWMNQIGGLAIAIAILFSINQLDSFHWSQIISSDAGKLTLAPFAFLAIAAMVKGAQPPFESWLLGAMVAPTPVSAILHSSTMVKIAPFMILKLAPVIAGTVVGFTVGLLGALSFVAMSLLALREVILKRVLAFSTIGLLGLMIMLASIGTTLSMTACLLLAFFHALAKALLFLEAGVLEKVYHIKTVDLLEGMLHKAPQTSILLLIGFLAMSVPPFGVFIGKWIALESSTASTLWIAAIAVGGSALTLLYFKVAGPICASSAPQKEILSKLYQFPTIFIAFATLLCGILYSHLTVYWLGKIASSITHKSADISAPGLTLIVNGSKLEFWYIGVAVLILAAIVIGAKKFNSISHDIAAPYNCAERTEPQPAPFLFFENSNLERFIILIGIALFVITAVAGVLGI